jgi:hypothetical protein
MPETITTLLDPDQLPDDVQEEFGELVEALTLFRDPDTKEKGQYAARVGSRHGAVFAALAKALAGRKLSVEERMFLRAGALSEELMNEDLTKMIREVAESKPSEESIRYADEWLRAVASGEMTASTVDEAKAGGNSRNRPASALLREAKEDLEAAKDSYMVSVQRIDEIHQEIENGLRGMRLAMDDLKDKLGKGEIKPDEFDAKYAEVRKIRSAAVSKLLSQAGKVSTADRGFVQEYRNFIACRSKVAQLGDEAGEDDSASVDGRVLSSEIDVMRQMMKMCVGPRGNSFPLLMQEMLRGMPTEVINTRERVEEELKEVEAIDPGVFIRRFKGADRRIVPHIVILPVYGNRGICWEPWPRENKGLPGRLVVPLISDKTPNRIVATALGAYRWQVAKEQAMHYWMEEGLTGTYYQAHIKDRNFRHEQEFIKEYVLWVTEEAQGRPKLEPESRALFWRYVPFSDERKEQLAHLGVFRGLIEKDQRRATSRFTSMAS